METLVEVLMHRDGLDQNEAIAQVMEAREAVAGGEDPEEVLEDWFGLEPDYIFDLI